MDPNMTMNDEDPNHHSEDDEIEQSHHHNQSDLHDQYNNQVNWNNPHHQPLQENNPEYPTNYDEDPPEIKEEGRAQVVDLTEVIRNKSSKSKVSQKDFKVLSVLGKGGFGTVTLVKKVAGPGRTGLENDEGQIYAMKIVKKIEIVAEKDTMHTKAERSILERASHPFIVQLIYAFQTNTKLFLVLEFAQQGEFFTLLEEEHTLTEDWSKFYLGEIALALGYLHEQHVIYRDLKPENILLAADGHVKLTDFGLCKEGISESNSATTFCGTIEYMAPEVLKRRGHNKGVDWWSLGTLMWDMINGMPPFSGGTREETMELIRRARVPFNNCYMTRNARNLVYQLLQKDPMRRLGKGTSENGGDYKEVISHSFFKEIDFEKLYKKEIQPPHMTKEKYRMKYGMNGLNNLNNCGDHLNSANLTEHFDNKFTGMDIPHSLQVASNTGGGHSMGIQNNAQSINTRNSNEPGHEIFDGFSYVAENVFNNYGRITDDDIRNQLENSQSNHNTRVAVASLARSFGAHLGAGENYNTDRQRSNPGDNIGDSSNNLNRLVVQANESTSPVSNSGQNNAQISGQIHPLQLQTTDSSNNSSVISPVSSISGPVQPPTLPVGMVHPGMVQPNPLNVQNTPYMGGPILGAPNNMFYSNMSNMNNIMPTHIPVSNSLPGQISAFPGPTPGMPYNVPNLPPQHLNHQIGMNIPSHTGHTPDMRMQNNPNQIFSPTPLPVPQMAHQYNPLPPMMITSNHNQQPNQPQIYHMGGDNHAINQANFYVQPETSSASQDTRAGM